MGKKTIYTIIFCLSTLLLFSACAEDAVLEQETTLTEGVSAKVLDIDPSGNKLLVSGLNENSILGTQCYVSPSSGGVTVLQLIKNDYSKVSFNKLQEGDVVTLTVEGSVMESYPARANITEIKINPVPNSPEIDPLALWEYYSASLAQATDIEGLLTALSYPDVAPISSHSVDTGDVNTLIINFDANSTYAQNINFTLYDQNAIILFSLIHDLDAIEYNFDSLNVPYSKDWAASVVRPSFFEKLEDAQDLGALLNVIHDINPAQEDYYTLAIFDINTEHQTQTKVFESTERIVVNNLLSLLEVQGDPIKKSNSDTPEGIAEYTIVSFINLDLTSTYLGEYFLYEDGGKHYVEIANEGIWEINQDTMQTVSELRFEQE